MLKIDVSDKNKPRLVSRVKNAFAEDFTNDLGETLIKFDFEEVTEEFDAHADNAFIFQPNEIYYFDFSRNLIPSSAVPASFAGNSNNSVGSVNRVAYYKNHVYVISSQNITVFKDENAFEKVNATIIGWQMETIFPYNDHLFVGTRSSMDIFSITDLDQPQRVGSFWHATSCDPVYPVDDVAFVTLRTGDFANCPGDENALVVLDINNLSNPLAIQEFEMESPYGMTLIGNKLYVGEGSNGLKIFDASNLKELKLDFWDQSVEAYDVIPHPTKTNLLLIAGPEGLGQYQIIGEDQLDLVSWLSM